MLSLVLPLNFCRVLRQYKFRYVLKLAPGLISLILIGLVVNKESRRVDCQIILALTFNELGLPGETFIFALGKLKLRHSNFKLNRGYKIRGKKLGIPSI